jgi:hypothetical protein
MAKRRKAFRRAALRLSKTALLFCRIFISMSIAKRIETIIFRQTFGLAESSNRKLDRCSPCDGHYNKIHKNARSMEKTVTFA